MVASGQSNRQGARDAATLLPIVATILLVPPLIRIFATSAMPLGVPLMIFYIFAVWATIILAAFFVARRVGEPESEPEDPSETDGRR